MFQIGAKSRVSCFWMAAAIWAVSSKETCDDCEMRARFGVNVGCMRFRIVVPSHWEQAWPREGEGQEILEIFAKAIAWPSAWGRRGRR